MANWKDLDKAVFSITCGDGKKYTPNMLNANLSVEYNVSQFNFRNISGTLVDRQNPMGVVYNLELVFQGADHIDKAKAFRLSANDKRPWTIAHPKYGQLFVQPIQGLFFDNNDHIANTTRITGPVMETFGKSKITVTASAPDVIATNKATTDRHYAENYVNAVPVPTVKDMNAMRVDTVAFSGIMAKISVGSEYIKNTYNKVNAAIDNAAHDAAGAIGGIQQFLSIPAVIEDKIINRIGYLVDEYNFLLAEARSLHFVPLKHLYQTNAGTCISSMCLASVYNISDTDYAYSSNAINVAATIIGSYNGYLTALDNLQTTNGGELDSFIPDVTSISSLENLVNYTVSALFDIAANAKQQRTFTLTKDNNWINIAYQIYGLVPDDSTLTTIMQDNNAGLKEMLQVRKGRNIVYYV